MSRETIMSSGEGTPLEPSSFLVENVNILPKERVFDVAMGFGRISSLTVSRFLLSSLLGGNHRSPSKGHCQYHSGKDIASRKSALSDDHQN